MPELGKLTAVFDADTRQFDAGVRGVATKIAGLRGEVSALTGGVGSAAGSLAGMSSKLGLAAGGAVIAASAIGGVAKALFDITTSAAEAAGKFVDLSQKTNFSVRTLSGLSIVAENTGSSIEGLSAALGIFQKNMVAAQDETSKQAKAFSDLKINTQDNEEALKEAFKALNSITNEAKQTAAAMTLFGRSGKDVLAIVKETNGDLDAAIRKYEEMGIVITDSAAKASDKFNDLLAETTKQLSAVTRSIGLELLPVATDALQQISNWLVQNKNTWQAWGVAIADAIRGVSVIANSQLGQVIGLLAQATGFVTGLTGTLRGLTGIGAGSRSGLGAAGSTTTGLLQGPSGSLLGGLTRQPISSIFGAGPTLGPFTPPAAGGLPPATFRGGGGGGGGRRGGGAGRATIGSVRQDFDEYYNLFDYFKKIREENEKILDDILHTPVESIEAIMNLYETIARGFPSAELGGVSTATGQLRDLIEAGAPSAGPLEAQVEARDRIRQASQDLADQLTGIFADSVATGFEQGAKRGLVSLAQGLLNVVEQVFLRRLAEGLSNIIFNTMSGGGGGGGFFSTLGRSLLGGLIGGIGGGLTGTSALLSAGRSVGPLSTSGTPLLTGLITRANGGPVFPGQPYLVGERGPEMFMPGTAGNIVPNGKGQTIIINVPVAKGSTYTSPKSRRELASQIASAVQGAL